MHTERSPYRRTRRTAVVVAATIALAIVATEPGAAAPSAEAFRSGTGSATALGYKVNPTNGNLSFGVTVGESIAGHQNTAATGQSRAINLGVIGVTLAGTACDGGAPTWAEQDQPQAVIVRSDDKDAATGKTEYEQGFPFGIEKFARATTAPYAEAITTIAPLGDPETVFINGGRTITHSGVVNGNTREALARTELGTVSLRGGVIKLQGLAWEAIDRTGAVNETIGTFTVGSVTIAGQAVSLPGDGFQQAAQLKALLDPLGFKITPPGVRVEQGIVFVDPLKIGVVPSAPRDGLTAPLISAAQPLRDQIVDALVAQNCKNSTYVTIADIALGSVTGAGALGLELGGVQATTADFTQFQFGALPGFTPPAEIDLPTSPLIAPSLPTIASGAAPTPQAAAAPVPTARTAPTPTKPIVNAVGERGGLLALIGGLGIVLLLASAEADRRKMRHALNVLPLEV